MAKTKGVAPPPPRPPAADDELDPILVEFGRRIADAIGPGRGKRSKAAAAIKHTPQNLSSVISGRRPLPAAKFIALAEHLGLEDIDALIPSGDLGEHAPLAWSVRQMWRGRRPGSLRPAQDPGSPRSVRERSDLPDMVPRQLAELLWERGQNEIDQEERDLLFRALGKPEEGTQLTATHFETIHRPMRLARSGPGSGGAGGR